MSIVKGALYVVATPIGNLGDMGPRALDVLKGVDLVAAEDTRHSGQLLRHFGIDAPLIAYHDHNEREMTPRLVAELVVGKSIALLSDAGTPLLSDPGYVLVRAVRAAGLRAIPVPGPSAVVTALSVAGLPAGRFAFEGFLPAKAAARRECLRGLASEVRTLVFYESPHRIAAVIADMAELFGAERVATIARELTKLHEEVHSAPLGTLPEWLRAQPHRDKGEFVIVVAGAATQQTQAEEGRRVLEILLADLPLKQAVALATRITGLGKNVLYEWALAWKGSARDHDS